MAYKEDYKDEIADRKYQLIDSRTGAVIYPAVKMERVDTPTQVGDKFGSKILNSIFNFMNGLLNGTVTVKNATNASAVPWSGVSDKPSTYAPSSHSHAFSAITGKPSTYAPTLGETSTTAYRGDKGKIVADEINKIKSGSTVVNKSSYLVGAKNKNKMSMEWDGEKVLVNVDSSVDRMVSNALMHNGNKIYASTIVTNPAGNNYVEVPLPSGITYLVNAIAINGNSVANDAFVVSRFTLNGKVRFLLNRATTGNIQIDYMILYH